MQLNLFVHHTFVMRNLCYPQFVSTTHQKYSQDTYPHWQSNPMLVRRNPIFSNHSKRFTAQCPCQPLCALPTRTTLTEEARENSSRKGVLYWRAGRLLIEFAFWYSKTHHCIVYLQEYFRACLTTHAKKRCCNQDTPPIDRLWDETCALGGGIWGQPTQERASEKRCCQRGCVVRPKSAGVTLARDLCRSRGNYYATKWIWLNFVNTYWTPPACEKLKPFEQKRLRKLLSSAINNAAQTE